MIGRCWICGTMSLLYTATYTTEQRVCTEHAEAKGINTQRSAALLREVRKQAGIRKPPNRVTGTSMFD